MAKNKKNVNSRGGRPAAAENAARRWDTWFEIVARLDYCSVEVLRSVLSEMPSVEFYIGAIHDSDIRADGSAKNAHLHALIKLRTQVRNSTVLNKFHKAALAACPAYAEAYAVKLAENAEQAPFAVMTAPVRSRPCAAVTYLLHLTVEAIRDEKFRYDVGALFASDGLDAAEYFAKMRAEYDDARASGDSLSASLRSEGSSGIDVDEIERRYYAGELRRWNSALNLSFTEWRDTRKIIRDLSEYDAARRKQAPHPSPVSILWMYGGAGTGKTSNAVFMSYDNGFGMPYISSGGADVFSHYGGQPVVVLDDIRPDKIDPDSLIKLLNPENYGAAFASRYNNAETIDIRYIIVCVPMSPEEWWECYPEKQRRAAGGLKQLLRRCNAGVMHFTDRGCFTLIQYDDNGEIIDKAALVVPPAYKEWIIASALAAVPPVPLYRKYYSAEQIAAAPARRLTVSDCAGEKIRAILQADVDAFAAENPEIAARMLAGDLTTIRDVMSALPVFLNYPGVSLPEYAEEMPFPEASEGASEGVSDEVDNSPAEAISAAPGASEGVSDEVDELPFESPRCTMHRLASPRVFEDS